MYVYIYVNVCMRICQCMYACMNVSVHVVCVCVCVCVCACICVCLCASILREAGACLAVVVVVVAAGVVVGVQSFVVLRSGYGDGGASQQREELFICQTKLPQQQKHRAKQRNKQNKHVRNETRTKGTDETIRTKELRNGRRGEGIH